MPAQVIQPGTQEHKQVLEYFGLTPPIFQEIGAKIFGGFNQATPNDAKTAAGTYAYLAAIKALRDSLRPLGWQLHREGNIEMVLASTSQFAITASSGDKNTGRAEAEPQTRNSKGNQTSELVFKNRSQIFGHYLFPEMEPPAPVYDPNKTPTWFLLYHVDSNKNETRMELSLPIDIDTDTLKVNQWKERIILSDVRFDGTPINRADQEDLYTDFEVEIKRITNE